MENWTREFHEMQYLPYRRKLGKTWLSVARFPNGAELCEYFPGCGLSPNRTWHKSVEEAKLAGEQIIGGHNE
ncbi:MAG: hypothetical protein ABIL06_13140 [Pseudomonadota bacterium]|uniref:Uncharacterized protein n=1 Tax=viral metagenome TaxID=1070528 RepID=A0A6M3KN44_9ZZZZ